MKSLILGNIIISLPLSHTQRLFIRQPAHQSLKKRVHIEIFYLKRLHVQKTISRRHKNSVATFVV